MPPSIKKRGQKKALTQWVEPEVIQQIKLIAVEQGKQQQEIINEALNMEFARYRKPEIAQPKRRGRRTSERSDDRPHESLSSRFVAVAAA